MPGGARYHLCQWENSIMIHRNYTVIFGVILNVDDIIIFLCEFKEVKRQNIG